MGWPKGKKRSAETKAKMSAAHQERLKDPEARAQLESSLAMGRGPHSEEARAKISVASKGKPKSEAHKEAIRQANLGKHASPETKAKMSEAWHANPHLPTMTDEGRARQVASVTRKHTTEEITRRTEAMNKAWDAKGHKHFPETIEKMKEARARQITPYKDTKPELQAQAILDARGVIYRKHFCAKGLGRHQFDLALPERMLLIEIDGCYWHGCKACYPNSAIGAKNAANDQIQTHQAEAAGWTVLRIWEHELAAGSVPESLGRMFPVSDATPEARRSNFTPAP